MIEYTLQCGTKLPEIEDDYDQQLCIFPTKSLMEESEKIYPELLQADAFSRIAARAVHLMYKKRGIGLAASQIGLNDRFFVWDCQYPESGEQKPHFIMNPTIEFDTEEVARVEEGCLSVALDWRVQIDRVVKVTISGLDYSQNSVQYESSNMLEAACWQHEMDHLNGILTINYDGRTRRELYERKLLKYARKFYHQEKNEKLMKHHLAKINKRGRHKK